MITSYGLNDTFQFLVLEVITHIRQTSTFLAAPEAELFDEILSKDDYIDNLKNGIENACFRYIAAGSGHGRSRAEISTCRSMQTIAVNLERISDFCVNIVRQVQYLSDPFFLQSFSYQDMIREILDGIADIPKALRDKDLPKTLGICRRENTLDKMYKVHFEQIMQQLHPGPEKPGDYITALFIIHYLERIGDSLQNIGEAILFAIIGEKIKINQFQALQENLNKSGLSTRLQDVDLEFIWGTRSGCRIGRVGDKTQGTSRQGAIFKEGAIRKIRREKKNLEYWQTIFPGLVPKIFSYHEDDQEGTASLLIEYLAGCTLDEILLTESVDRIQNAAFILSEVLHEVWTGTMDTKHSRPPGYMRQLDARLDSVFRVHPQFKSPGWLEGDRTVQSPPALIRDCMEKERYIPIPWTVWTHGDLNVNNIVYNHGDQTIHCIDLHRSRHGDYIQDVSVFLVSNFRLPVFDPDIRKRLQVMIEEVYAFAASFAAEQGDRTFQARLALALARSFCTSTRFELNAEFASAMFQRSLTLMDMVAHHTQGWESFVLPMDVLFK